VVLGTWQGFQHPLIGTVEPGCRTGKTLVAIESRFRWEGGRRDDLRCAHQTWDRSRHPLLRAGESKGTLGVHRRPRCTEAPRWTWKAGAGVGDCQVAILGVEPWVAVAVSSVPGRLDLVPCKLIQVFRRGISRRVDTHGRVWGAEFNSGCKGHPRAVHLVIPVLLAIQ